MRTDPQLDFERGFSFPGLGLPGRHFLDGVSQSGRERNHLFVNLQAENFADLSGVSGLDDPGDGRVFAWLDFDRDGWRDVALVNANRPFFQLFRNELGDGGLPPVLSIRLVGGNRSARPAPGRSARDGYGAQVRVTAEGRTQLIEHRAGDGLATQNGPRMLVGLGGAPRAEQVEVRWPSGRRTRIEHVAAGTELTVYEDASAAPGGAIAQRAPYGPALPLPAPVVAPQPVLALSSTGGAQPARLRVLTTFATWCESCRQELPQVALLREVFEADELELYGVPVDPDDTQRKLAAWARAHRPAYRVLADLPDEEVAVVRQHVSRTLRRDALPASVITDADGRVLDTLWGVPSVSRLRRFLEPGSGG